MIVTHTISASGHRRVYLGGKASLECWIEPAQDGIAWSFHVEPDPANHVIDDQAKRQWAIHMLMQLAHELSVPPHALREVPFERIAALHAANPQEYKRVPVPRKQVMEHGYMAMQPNVLRPSSKRDGSTSSRTCKGTERHF